MHDDGVVFFRKSAAWSIRIVLFCVFGMLLYFFVTRFLYPYVIKPLWEMLKRMLTGWKSSSVEGKFKENFDLLQNPTAAKGIASMAAAFKK